jgi:hypothetical protein
VFWLAQQGVYFFNGGAPSYIGEDVRGLIETFTWADRQNAVGSYSDRTFYLSFPSTNITLCYYTPTQKWYTRPYGCTLAVSNPFNQNQLLFVNGAQLQQVNASYTQDLGASIVSTWTSGVSDSDLPGQIKDYRFIQLIAPIQPGKATVTLTIDGAAQVTNTFSVTWDLSQGNGAHVYSLPPSASGYTAQLSIQTTTGTGAFAPVTIRDVVVSGGAKHDLVATNTPDLLSVVQNGTQIYPVGIAA